MRPRARFRPTRVCLSAKVCLGHLSSVSRHRYVSAQHLFTGRSQARDHARSRPWRKGPILLRGTSAAFLFRVTALALNSIAAAELLARFLGPAGFGAFAWSLAIVTILRLLVSGGFNLLIVREAAAAMAGGSWARLRGVMDRSASVWLAGSSIARVARRRRSLCRGRWDGQQREALVVSPRCAAWPRISQGRWRQ